MTGGTQGMGGWKDGIGTVPVDCESDARVAGDSRGCGISWFALLFLAVANFGTGSRVLADGKVFPSRAEAVEVRMPDQRAPLWWSNGVERLVIESRFIGQAEVIPLTE